jgi:hypothetical protein
LILHFERIFLKPGTKTAELSTYTIQDGLYELDSSLFNLLQLFHVRHKLRLDSFHLMIGAFNRLFEALTCYLRLVLDCDAIFVYSRHLVVRYVASVMCLHGFLYLEILLVSLLLHVEVAVTCLLLALLQFLELAHEVGAFGERVSAIVGVELLVSIDWFYKTT